MKLSSISNLFARLFIIFLIVYLWASYYFRGFLAIFVVSVFITFLINLLITKLLTKKRVAQSSLRKEAESMHRAIIKLRFYSKQDAQKLFYEALSKKFECEKLAKCIHIKNGDSTLAFFAFFHKEVELEDVIACINARRNMPIIIAGESFNPKIIAFVRSLNLKIKLIGGEEVYYQILREADIMPQKTVEIRSSARRTLCELRSVIFAKERTRAYIITGVIIFLSSFVVRFSVFYRLVATFVFALALISYFAPMHSKTLFDI